MRKEAEAKSPKISGSFKAGVAVLAAVGLSSLALAYRVGVADRDGVANRENLAKEQADILQEKGLIGEIPIIDLREVPGFNFNGQAAAGFLITTGTFRGENTQMLQFAWKPEGDRYIQISQVPIRNVKYLIADDPNTESTVLFTGMNPELFRQGDMKPINHPNANYYVDKAADQIVVFNLSREDWGKFRRTQDK